MPVQTPEQRVAAKAADAEFTELYKILMKEKNVGFDRAAAIIGRLSVERLNKPYKTGTTVLSKAMNPKSIRIVEALLQKGVSALKANADENPTYLYEAACETPEMVRLFLNRGIDINGGSIPPLIGAAGNKKFGIEIATLLLANGADINRVSANGSNALMTACYDGNKKMVEFLLARGADVNVRGPGNQTILFSASRGKKKTYIDIFKLLLTKGVDINAVDANGKNVLTVHFDSVPNPDFVKLVAARGVRLDGIDAQGNNLLHKCLSLARIVYKPEDMKPCFETARFLIANGVNINLRNNDRQTPFLYSLVSRNYAGIRDTPDFVNEVLALLRTSGNVAGVVTC
jgi:cytohesin